jgi:hypothetical protein
LVLVVLVLHRTGVYLEATRCSAQSHPQVVVAVEVKPKPHLLAVRVVVVKVGLIQLGHQVLRVRVSLEEMEPPTEATLLVAVAVAHLPLGIMVQPILVVLVVQVLHHLSQAHLSLTVVAVEVLVGMFLVLEVQEEQVAVVQVVLSQQIPTAKTEQRTLAVVAVEPMATLVAQAVLE